MRNIDYALIVGTQVLCEFWEEREDHIKVNSRGFLTGISEDNGANEFWLDNKTPYSHCRIYQHPDYWIANPDGKLVLPDGLEVKLKTDDRKMWVKGITKNNSVSNLLTDEPLFIGNYNMVQVTGLADEWEC